MGHTLVMGRTTYESIGRPLPGRTTDRADPRPGLDAPTASWSRATSTTALALADDLAGDVMVAGGSQVYAAALPSPTSRS